MPKNVAKVDQYLYFKRHKIFPDFRRSNEKESREPQMKYKFREHILLIFCMLYRALFSALHNITGNVNNNAFTFH